uniref:Uncharacterized protein n=1 Tax=Arundo donax TaxID=35708 RepID=A0A0A9D4X5_ARUDO
MVVDGETYMCFQTCTALFLNNKHIPLHSAVLGSPNRSTVLYLPLQPFLGGGETCKLLQICTCQSLDSTSNRAWADMNQQSCFPLSKESN